MGILNSIFGRKQQKGAEPKPAHSGVTDQTEPAAQATALVSQALEIIKEYVVITPKWVEVRSAGSEGNLIQAATKLERAHNLQPLDPVVHYAWASALHIAKQYKSAQEQMTYVAQSHPDFRLARLAIQGWQLWESPFTLPPLSANTTIVHPSISGSVKTAYLLAVRDGLLPRTALFLRDRGAEFQDISALAKAKIEITSLISPITSPQVTALYAKIWDNPERPYDIETTDFPFCRRGDGERQKWEFLCLQDDIDFVVIDNRDAILLNRRIHIPQLMDGVNKRILQILEASDGSEYSTDEVLDAFARHRRIVSTADPWNSDPNRWGNEINGTIYRDGDRVPCERCGKVLTVRLYSTGKTVLAQTSASARLIEALRCQDCGFVVCSTCATSATPGTAVCPSCSSVGGPYFLTPERRHSSSAGRLEKEEEIKRKFGLVCRGNAWSYDGFISNEFVDQFGDPGTSIAILRKLQTELGFNEICVLAGQPALIVLNSKDTFCLLANLTVPATKQLVSALVGLGGVLDVYRGIARLKFHLDMRL